MLFFNTKKFFPADTFYFICWPLIIMFILFCSSLKKVGINMKVVDFFLNKLLDNGLCQSREHVLS